MRTSIGQLLVNSTLPEDLRDYTRTLDKKSLSALLTEVAERYPEEYRDISHKLSRIGQHVAYTSGGNSVGLADMLQSKSAKAARRILRVQLERLNQDDTLTDEQRDEKVLRLVGKLSSTEQDTIYDESLAEDNPLARQILSGSRGNKMNLASLRGSDLLYTDHRGNAIPFPILRSYSQGLTPAEYWAGSYGARKGIIDLKFATQDAGFLSKQLNQIIHRSLVTDMDHDGEPDTLIGLPVDVDDSDSEGSLLARPAGGYARNTVLTPKILARLRRKKIKRILVRSPAVSGAPDGGVYSRDVGIREFGRLPYKGENVGLAAAQALSEPLTQAQISSKHSGGVASASAEKAIGGFERINQLIQTPKAFKGGAAHATLDGMVQFIEDAPAGGKYVMINNNKHYVGSGFDLTVRRGDKVEAGDVISEGVPNPAIIVQHKGIGEGRRYFINTFREAFKAAGIKGHRRNIELLARGLINHVRLTEEAGDFAPDDIVPYSMLEHSYKPRDDSRDVNTKRAVGQYLERPYLHHSIGTKVRPSMLADFKDFGIKQLRVHKEPPPFEAEMVRGMANMQHDPDWITRMFGSGLKTSLLKGVHRGASSEETGTSFVPGLAKAVNFGQIGKVITPKPPQDDQQRVLSSPIKSSSVLVLQAEEMIKQAVEPKRTPEQIDWGAPPPPPSTSAPVGQFNDGAHQSIQGLLWEIENRREQIRHAHNRAEWIATGTTPEPGARTLSRRVGEIPENIAWSIPPAWPLMIMMEASKPPPPQVQISPTETVPESPEVLEIRDKPWTLSSNAQKLPGDSALVKQWNMAKDKQGPPPSDAGLWQLSQQMQQKFPREHDTATLQRTWQTASPKLKEFILENRLKNANEYRKANKLPPIAFSRPTKEIIKDSTLAPEVLQFVNPEAKTVADIKDLNRTHYGDMKKRFYQKLGQDVEALKPWKMMPDQMRRLVNADVDQVIAAYDDNKLSHEAAVAALNEMPKIIATAPAGKLHDLMAIQRAGKDMHTGPTEAIDWVKSWRESRVRHPANTVDLLENSFRVSMFDPDYRRQYDKLAAKLNYKRGGYDLGHKTVNQMEKALGGKELDPTALKRHWVDIHQSVKTTHVDQLASGGLETIYANPIVAVERIAQVQQLQPQQMAAAPPGQEPTQIAGLVEDPIMTPPPELRGPTPEPAAPTAVPTPQPTQPAVPALAQLANKPPAQQPALTQKPLIPWEELKPKFMTPEKRKSYVPSGGLLDVGAIQVLTGIGTKVRKQSPPTPMKTIKPPTSSGNKALPPVPAG